MNPDFIARLNALRQTRREMLGFQQWQGVMSSSNSSAPWQGVSPQVLVYDTRTGRAYPNPQAAISAGVTDYSYNLPAGMTVDWGYWDQFKQPKKKDKVKVNPIKVADQTVTPTSGIISRTPTPDTNVAPSGPSGPTRMVVVYGPDGTQYANPAAAKAAGVTDWSYTKGGSPANEEEGRKIGDYNPEDMKGTEADIAGQFKTGQARQHAKTWRQKHMEAAKKKHGGDNMTKEQKSAYIKQRNKIANRHRIMIGAGAKTLKDGSVIGVPKTGGGN